MRRFPHLAVLGVLLACLTSSALSHAAKKELPVLPAQTYTVMVGAESPHRGVGFNAYFPESVTIHVGDTVQVFPSLGMAANACKGQSACKGANNSCKGQNACKGQGWVETGTTLECIAIGGKPQN